MKNLRQSLTLVTIAGCLFMVFMTGTTCPAQTEFFRSLGATEFHFGLIGGIPLILLFLQFVGAHITNRVKHRKPSFMVLNILGRLLYIPVVLIPLLFPSLAPNIIVPTLIALIGIGVALTNTGATIWFSWMADLIPNRILNTYWGARQRWMFITLSIAYLAVAAFTHVMKDESIRIIYLLLVMIAVVAGVVDILLFIWVKEPTNTTNHEDHIFKTLIAPLKDRDYRSFVMFISARFASVMFAAAFIPLYLLKELGLTVAQTTLIWCIHSIGIAFWSPRWGKMADKHGHKPILIICAFFKPAIILALLLVTPVSVLWLAPLVLLFDSIWTSGNIVVTHGYMLKIAPRKNRSMFIAAITGISGLCGGLAAVAGGWFLTAFSDFSLEAAGRTWDNYHLLFATDIILRLLCIILALRVRESKSSKPAHVLNDILGAWPLRFLRFPLGLYRNEDRTWP